MIPEAIIALLAVVRLGAIHSVVFAGFSSGSLTDRVLDASSKVVITTDEGRRGGKNIGTKKIVDEALKDCPDVKHVLVFKRTNSEVPWTAGRDYWWHEEIRESAYFYFPPVEVSAEDSLFLLYTSGSTGKPKGVLHTTAGYLLGAAMTGKYVFDIHPNDVFFSLLETSAGLPDTHMCSMRRCFSESPPLFSRELPLTPTSRVTGTSS